MDYDIVGLRATVDDLLELVPPNRVLLEDQTDHVEIDIFGLGGVADDGLQEKVNARFGAGQKN